MRELKIGLIKKDPHWENVLEQEGVSFEVVSEEIEKYPLLIVNEKLEFNKKTMFEDYIENGGLVLSFTSFFESACKQKKVSSFIPKDNYFFRGISFFSLNSRIYTLKDASYENVENIVFSRKVGKGKVILLSFNLSQVMNNFEYSPAPIFTPSGPIFQILPNVSRNAIRKLVRNCLIDLFEHAGFPYVKLSNFPSGFNGAFIFRVDVDNYFKKDFYETIKLLKKNKIKTTFFINQKSSIDVSDIKKLEEEKFEIQSHMNKHCVYDSAKKNYDNLIESLEFLKEFNPIAFVAPFGIFNKSLIVAAEKAKMRYSSEFSYDYDNLPSFPVLNGRKTHVLQIPIHPICIENFIEAGRDDDAILEHFHYTLRKSVKERLPILFYAHPTKVFKNHPTYFQVFDRLLNRVNKLNKLWKVTFIEFYEWWINRLKFKYNVYFTGSHILLKWKRNLNIDIEIFYKNKFKTSKLMDKIDLKRMKIKQDLQIDTERIQYKKSSKDFLSKLKFKLLNKYLNYKNMKE